MRPDHDAPREHPVWFMPARQLELGMNRFEVRVSPKPATRGDPVPPRPSSIGRRFAEASLSPYTRRVYARGAGLGRW